MRLINLFVIGLGGKNGLELLGHVTKAPKILEIAIHSQVTPRIIEAVSHISFILEGSHPDWGFDSLNDHGQKWRL